MTSIPLVLPLVLVAGIAIITVSVIAGALRRGMGVTSRGGSHPAGGDTTLFFDGGSASADCGGGADGGGGGGCD